MTTASRRFAMACAALLLARAAAAQTPQTASPTASSTSSSSGDNVRLATTTFTGDTGLWFVPTAEVLPHGKWSASGYRRGTNYIQGYTNVADFAGTFAFGVKDRAEVFGSFLVDTRIDRDLRPLFGPETDFGGIVYRNPAVHTTWTGDNVGDFYLGVKYNIWSEYRQKPVAMAVRAIVKLPTGKQDVGNGTGQVDGSFDFIVSKEVKKAVEVSSFVGFQMWGKPDGYDT